MATHNIKALFASEIPVKEFNKALVCLDKKDYDKAIQLLNKVLRAQEFREVWLNLAVAYKGKNNFSRSKECLLKALDPSMPFSDGTFKPTWPLALTNLGLLHYSQEEDDIAEQYYKTALTSDPLYYDAIWSLALAKLRQYCSGKYNDLPRAWEYYSYRFKRSGASPLKNRKTSLRMWDFKSSGDSVVVLIEQGMGDAMMFGRYLIFLRKYFKDIYIQCTPEMDYIFSSYKVCRDAIETPAEVGVPMCSLGKLCSVIPAGDWLANKYKPSNNSDILCIWSGNKDHANSSNRNAPAWLFDRFKSRGVVHSVEKRSGYKLMPIIDWEYTIKYLENIGTVITIDSSMAHICGALGKPCYVLMPLNDGDFRWGDSSMGVKNMWYDSVKVIRNPGSWEKTMDNLECLMNS